MRCRAFQVGKDIIISISALLFVFVAGYGVAQAAEEYEGEGTAQWHLIKCSDIASCEAKIKAEVSWNPCTSHVTDTYGDDVVGPFYNASEVYYVWTLYCKSLNNLNLGKNFGAVAPITSCPGGEAPPCGGDVLEVPPPVTPPCNDTNPCNPANGNKSQTEIDYVSTAAGGLSLRRYYNSGGAYKTGYGMHAGWRHSYSRALDEEPDRYPTLPASVSVARSSTYGTAAEACTSGWAEMKPVVWSGDLATATATFIGGNDCRISMGGSTVAYMRIRHRGVPAPWVPPAGVKTITRPNGSSHKFELVGTDWVNPLNPALELEQSVGNWIFTDASDTQETYNASGQLTTIAYRNGQSETLEHDLSVAQGGDSDASTLDKVTGPFGHTLTFDYDANGRLITVNTPDGTIQYVEGSNNNLSTATYPDTSARQYLYEIGGLPNHLTGIEDENNDRFATWDYDALGRAVLSEHAGGKERIELAYNADDTTTLTLANGATRTYAYTTAQGERRISTLTGDACGICPGGNIKDRSYDSNGFLAERTDWIGNVTKTARNARGLVETLTEAFGTASQRTTTTLWHANYRLPSQITSPQNVTDYTYDANGNVLTVTVAGGGESRSWIFTYNSNGQPLTIDGPRTDVSDVTTLEYYVCIAGDECGQLKKITNALGHITNYNSYDSAGRPTLMTDPNGLQTSISYDSRGRVLTTTQTPTVGAARVTTITYDNAGQLLTLTSPTGASLTYTHDAAHYLTSITDNLGNSVSYNYDVMGNLTDEDTYDPSSTLKRVLDYVHDLNYRLDTVTDGGFASDLTFDLVGNLTNEEDANTNATQHTYDALNRLDTTIDALTGVIDYNYDDHDNLTKVIAANGATTDYVYDNLDNLVSETSPDRGLTTYTYDDAGNRLTATDARTIMSTYTYDALNRLTSVTYPTAAENVTYTYDNVATNGLGRLTSISDQSETTTYTYDDFGSVATDQRQVSGVSYTVSYQYDAAGNVSSIAYPSGRTVDYGRDSIGQITQVTSTKSSTVKNIVTSATYEPFGPIKGLTYGNGLDFDYQHRTDYRTTNISSTSILDKWYSYDPTGNITSISDTIDASKGMVYSFDALNRLEAEAQANVFDYDVAVQLDAPIVYWRLGEPSGTTAIDSSGNGHDGTYINTVTLGEPGLVGGGDTAMGITTYGSGYVVGPTLTGTTVTGIEAWFETTVAGSYRTLINVDNTASDRAVLAHNANGTAGIWSPSVGYLLSSDGVVSINEPHHISVWYESGPNTTYLMIDGMIQQATYTGNLLAATNPKLDLAAYRYGNIYATYQGTIDEAAIYDGAVTAATFSGHFTAAAGVSAGGTDYAYDANGNRTSLDDGSSVTTYGYQALSNQLTSIDSAAVTLDDAGNQIADASGTRTYSYDDSNRLDEVFDNSVLTASYVHNALGQRTVKSVGGTDTIYIYDFNGGLLAEHDDTGTLIRDYVRLNGTPVAQIDQGEVVSYLHFDHLGTPRQATDDSQAIVWRWDGDAFGSVLPDEDPDGNGTSVTVNLRFAGQYYDQESGLHYNYFRTYDPSTGRYMESDPIGLAAGPNTYAYVSNGPTTQTDRYGLANDNGILHGLPSPYRDQMRDHIANQPAPVADALVNHGKTIGGALTYARGNYRSLRHLARSSGLLGKCEKVKAALEGQALAEALDRLSNDPGMRSDLSDLIFATAASNPYRTLGRASAGSLVTYYSRGSLGLAGALGALNGDIRNLVETQGPNIALDKLAEAIALGKVPQGAQDFLDQAIDCSCYE